MQEFTIHKDDSDQRLDRFLRKLFPHMSMSEIFSGIRTGKIKVNRKKKANNHRIQEGDQVQLFYLDETLDSYRKQRTKLKQISKLDPGRILFEDDDILAYNKPAGLVVHSTDHAGKESTLIELSRAYLASKAENTALTFDPSLAHRLDRETSGITLIAKTKASLENLTKQFRERTIKKTYQAYCHGTARPKEGAIKSSLRRIETKKINQPKVLVDEQKGLQAHTDYKTADIVHLNNDIFSLITCHPETGRMHQIRAHLASIGCPIIGDKRYGESNLKMQDNTFFKTFLPEAPKHHLLHASKITFVHPKTKKPMDIECPWDIYEQVTKMKII